MKSYKVYALDVVCSIITDCSLQLPELSSSLEKDLSYLRRATEERGLSFLTITLPDYGKHLDKCLSTGLLTSVGLPRGIPARNSRPALGQGLLHRIFDQEGLLRPNACITSIAFLRQILYLCKKLRLQCEAPRVTETLDEFYAIEERLPKAHPYTWDSDVPEWKARTGHPIFGENVPSDINYAMHIDTDSAFKCDHTIRWERFDRLCRIISSSFGELVTWDIEPKHGPGAVSESVKVGSKYDFPFWPRKLDTWFPYDWFGSGNLCSELIPSDKEPPSRLIAVPKTQKGPRLICAEPTAHQWIQQGIWRWLEEKVYSSVLRHCIDFRSQEESRNMALRSSVDGSHSTIDLSSASDRLSTRLVEYVFQGNQTLLDALHACRTRSLAQTISGDHPWMIVLRKFAPMGSAVTFPVQSIVFSMISLFALCEEDDIDITPDNLDLLSREIRVFGDDIIVPKRSTGRTLAYLRECGLKPNTSKTYTEGFFRESCGMDAYRGHDVTPAYILEPYDGSPSSLATTVEVSNNFHKKGYWRTASALVDELPAKEQKLLAITSSDDGAFGLISFCGSMYAHLQCKWDDNLHKHYYRSLSVSSKVHRERGHGSSDLAQYFFERPVADHDWSAGTVRRVALRKGTTRVYPKG